MKKPKCTEGHPGAWIDALDAHQCSWSCSCFLRISSGELHATPHLESRLYAPCAGGHGLWRRRSESEVLTKVTKVHEEARRTATTRAASRRNPSPGCHPCCRRLRRVYGDTGPGKPIRSLRA